MTSMRDSAHPSDDRLLEIAVDRPSNGEAVHLSQCEACRERRVHLGAFLQSVTEAASADVDRFFTPGRLSTQRERILQRVSLEARQARIIAFPAAAGEPRTFRSRPASRWVAVAAAAGLTVGVAVGRLTYNAARFRVPPQDAPAITMVTPGIVLSDDELIGEIELAASGPLPVLLPLHALTPIVASDDDSD